MYQNEAPSDSTASSRHFADPGSPFRDSSHRNLNRYIYPVMIVRHCPRLSATFINTSSLILARLSEVFSRAVDYPPADQRVRRCMMHHLHRHLFVLGKHAYHRSKLMVIAAVSSLVLARLILMERLNSAAQAALNRKNTKQTKNGSQAASSDQGDKTSKAVRPMSPPLLRPPPRRSYPNEIFLI